jgi:hypothetical protein
LHDERVFKLVEDDYGHYGDFPDFVALPQGGTAMVAVHYRVEP